jgi:hypothetical protein
MRLRSRAVAPSTSLLHLGAYQITKSWGYMLRGAASRHEVAATFRARVASFQNVSILLDELRERY